MNMKLRNKKTGDIKEVIVGGYPVSGKTKMWQCSEMDMNEETGYKILGTYTSLAELNEEWEDYQEPKTRWYIYGAEPLEVDDENWNEEFINELKITGNYFESKEEAEKAVEKLKAWKRLKDKGFKFEWWISKPEGNEIDFYLDEFEWSGQVKDDLDLLFGGENESIN